MMLLANNNIQNYFSNYGFNLYNSTNIVNVELPSFEVFNSMIVASRINYANINYNLNEFNNKINENIKLYCEDLSDNKNKLSEYLGNFTNSKKYLISFLSKVNKEKFFRLSPDVTIDNDGEITIEWFGEIGSRCSLTFGGDGLLYFASMNKGLSVNFKQFINRKYISIIENEIEKIYKSVK